MTALLFNLDSDPQLADQLARLTGAEPGQLNRRNFPDLESYLRVDSDCRGRSCIILCNLFQPNDKILPLLFLAETLRELEAASIALVTPYLSYMRQDIRFRPGECVSARPFARLLSDYVDFLVTVDPHLHRIHSLDEVYSIPSRVVRAAPLIASWVRSQVEKPLFIGPDSESEQWVSEVAELAGAPCLVMEKIRHGDRDVEVTVPELRDWQDYTPVLVDDIISSGRTMLSTLGQLQNGDLRRGCCIGVHGIFADQAWQELQRVADVVTTTTIPHPSNRIDISEALARPLREWLEQAPIH